MTVGVLLDVGPTCKVYLELAMERGGEKRGLLVSRVERCALLQGRLSPPIFESFQVSLLYRWSLKVLYPVLCYASVSSIRWLRM